MRFNDFQLMKDRKPVSFKEAKTVEYIDYLVWRAKNTAVVVLLEDA